MVVSVALSDDETRTLEGAPPTERSRREELGLVVGDRLGRYEIHERIGKGGMGVVHAAWDPRLDRRIALKVLHSAEPEDGSEGRRRLLDEARALAQLAHPNVVEIYDVGLHGDMVFIAMELIEGQTLSTWRKQGDRPWPEILEVFEAAGRGLAAAHAARLVHRDFKPSNVLIGPGSRVRVVDFGLAMAAGDESGAESTEGVSSWSRDSHSSLVIEGTPGFTAPEQWAGDPPDARSDQFSFCVALYLTVFRRYPYERGAWDDPQAVPKLREPERLGVLPAGLWPVLARGLEADPAVRHPSMEALLGALRPPRRTKPWIVAGVVAVGALAVGLQALQSPPDPPDPCAPGRERLVETWNDDVDGEIREAIAAADEVRGSQTAVRVSERLGNYASAWTQSHDELCEPADHEASMTCLDERLDDLRSIADALRNADEAVVERALQLVELVAMPSTCTPDVLAHSPDPPALGEADAVARIRRGLRSAKVARTLGRLDDAQEELEAAEREAESIAYAPGKAELLFAQARLAQSRGELEQAEATLVKAAHAAQSADHDRVYFGSASQLMHLLGSPLARLDDALEWGRHAETALARYGGTANDQIELARLRGTAYDRAMRLPEAREQFERALAIARDNALEDEDIYVVILASLGVSCIREGRIDEGIRLSRRAHEMAREAFGPEHHTTILYESNVASAYIMDGRYADALPLIEHQVSFFERSDQLGTPAAASGIRLLGVTHEGLGNLDEAQAAFERALRLVEDRGDSHAVERASALNSLGVFFRGAGKLDLAEQRFEQAIPLYEETLGADHPETSNTRANLGAVFGERGRHEDALKQFEIVLRDLDARLGAEHPALVEPLLFSARFLRATERPALALAQLERAHAIASKVEISPGLRSRLELELAQALVRTGGDRGRARTLAGVVAARGKDESKGTQETAEQAGAWLESLGPEG